MRELQFYYVNYKGKLSLRRVQPTQLWFGSTEYHPQEQWLLEARDLDKDAKRDFALKDIAFERPLREAFKQSMTLIAAEHASKAEGFKNALELLDGRGPITMLSDLEKEHRLVNEYLRRMELVL